MAICTIRPHQNRYTKAHYIRFWPAFKRVTLTSFTPTLSRSKARFSSEEVHYQIKQTHKWIQSCVCAHSYAQQHQRHSNFSLFFCAFSSSHSATKMGCRFLTKFIKLGCVPYINGYFVRILLSDGKKYTQNKKKNETIYSERKQLKYQVQFSSTLFWQFSCCFFCVFGDWAKFFSQFNN